MFSRLLSMKAAWTTDALWRTSVAVLILPLAVFGIGLFGAILYWGSVEFSSYWSLTALVLLLPGTIVVLTVFPGFHRLRSVLVGFGFFTIFCLMAVSIAGMLAALSIMVFVFSN